MSNLSPQTKTTPARRKQGRSNGRSAGQKAYASENDAGMFESGQQRQAPQTPDKTGSRTPGVHQTHTGSKQRSKAKNRGKGNQTSPDTHQPDHSTPPPQQRRASMKSNAVPAFAGATFHASPAPSALPLPSFLSKTSTESPLARSVMRPSPPATDNEAPTPALSSSAPKAHESPLDFMFRAHRQEKQREYGDYSSHDYQDFNNASPAQGPTGQRPSTDPRPNTRASAGIGREELDGSHGLPIGPAFSTPYQERINAARASRQVTPNQGSNGSPASNPSQDDPSEALKKFLFGSNLQSNAMQSPPAHIPAPPKHQHQMEAVPPGGRPSNILAMENDLRRILKLDLGADSSSNSRRYFPN